jgi:hypothetical protein
VIELDVAFADSVTRKMFPEAALIVTAPLLLKVWEDTSSAIGPLKITPFILKMPAECRDSDVSKLKLVPSPILNVPSENSLQRAPESVDTCDSITARAVVSRVTCIGVVLIGGRLAQGVGAAMMTPAALSILTTSFHPRSDRVKALGFLGWYGRHGGRFRSAVGWRAHV